MNSADIVNKEKAASSQGGWAALLRMNAAEPARLKKYFSREKRRMKVLFSQ